MYLMIFTQVIHLYIDTISQCSKKDILNIFLKSISFWTYNYQFLEITMPHHTDMLCK